MSCASSSGKYKMRSCFKDKQFHTGCHTLQTTETNRTSLIASKSADAIFLVNPGPVHNKNCSVIAGHLNISTSVSAVASCNPVFLMTFWGKTNTLGISRKLFFPWLCFTLDESALHALTCADSSSSRLFSSSDSISFCLVSSNSLFRASAFSSAWHTHAQTHKRHHNPVLSRSMKVRVALLSS